MVAGAFPIAKLASLALKQISKPLATRIKNGAKSSPVFRNYVCMPPAQIYHWVEVNIKMRMLNLGKPTDVPKLNEAMAIELGAELLGEGIIFTVAAACLIAEYIRSSNKERDKEENRERKFEELTRTVLDMELRLHEQEARIRELGRMSYGMHSSISDLWRKNKKSSPSSELSSDSSTTTNRLASIPLITKAIDEADKAVKGKQR